MHGDDDAVVWTATKGASALFPRDAERVLARRVVGAAVSQSRHCPPRKGGARLDVSDGKKTCSGGGGRQQLRPGRLAPARTDWVCLAFIEARNSGLLNIP